MRWDQCYEMLVFIHDQHWFCIILWPLERGDFGERQKQLISKRLKHMFSNPPAKLSPSPHLPSTSQGRPGPTLDNQVDKFWEVHQRNFFVQFPHIFLEVSRIASSAILGSHHRSPSTSKILVHTTSTNIHVGDGSEWCSQPRRKTSGRKKWKWYWQDSAYCALHRNVGMPICMKMGCDLHLILTTIQGRGTEYK